MERTFGRGDDEYVNENGYHDHGDVDDHAEKHLDGHVGDFWKNSSALREESENALPLLQDFSPN